jgi:hypothetical protein
MMLMKRTNKTVSKEVINQIVNKEIADKVKKWDEELINSIFT